MGSILQFTNLLHTSTQKLQFSNEFLDIFVLEFNILPDFSKTKILHENQLLPLLILSPFKIHGSPIFHFCTRIALILRGK